MPFKWHWATLLPQVTPIIEFPGEVGAHQSTEVLVGRRGQDALEKGLCVNLEAASQGSLSSGMTQVLRNHRTRWFLGFLGSPDSYPEAPMADSLDIIGRLESDAKYGPAVLLPRTGQ